jgi:hypothetical protein
MDPIHGEPYVLPSSTKAVPLNLVSIFCEITWPGSPLIRAGGEMLDASGP